jgi:hypothetical protein
VDHAALLVANLSTTRQSGGFFPRGVAKLWPVRAQPRRCHHEQSPHVCKRQPSGLPRTSTAPMHVSTAARVVSVELPAPSRLPRLPAAGCRSVFSSYAEGCLFTTERRLQLPRRSGGTSVASAEDAPNSAAALRAASAACLALISAAFTRAIASSTRFSASACGIPVRADTS